MNIVRIQRMFYEQLLVNYALIIKNSFSGIRGTIIGIKPQGYSVIISINGIRIACSLD